MMETGYVCEFPDNVVSISVPKEKPNHRHWIILATKADSFNAARVDVGDDGKIKVAAETGDSPYSEMFAALGALAVSKKTTWCLAFGSRVALVRAKLVDELRDGTIQLERQLKLSGAKAGGGRVCLSNEFTDIDLRIAGRRVKILDWNNFGVLASHHIPNPGEIGLEKCLMIFSGLISACGEMDLSLSRTSAAQIGWDKLRRSLHYGQLFTSLHPDIRALERRCYYGGRCEPYRLGQTVGKVYSLDVKAAYGHICASQLVPSQPIRWFPYGCDVEMIKDDSRVCWAADVVVKTGEPLYPCRHLGKVIYPVGWFATSLCGLELAEAKRRGHLVRITRAASYVALPIFAGYANWYLQNRRAMAGSSHARYLPFLKSAYNSSLGFTARQGREWQAWSPAGSPPWWFGVTTNPDDHAGLVSAHVLKGEAEWLAIGSEPRNCSPIVHAAICAYGRVMLSEIMSGAGKDNVLYCDTDGVIVNAAGYARLSLIERVIGPEVGQLSVRHEAMDCHINGQKDYKIGEQVTCAGLPPGRHELWKGKATTNTGTGVVGVNGRVSPFVLECSDEGAEGERWVNTFAL